MNRLIQSLALMTSKISYYLIFSSLCQDPFNQHLNLIQILPCSKHIDLLFNDSANKKSLRKHDNNTILLHLYLQYWLSHIVDNEHTDIMQE